MLKHNFFIIIISFFCLTSYSQDCLEQSRIDFKDGKIQKVLADLTECFPSIQDINKIEAYRLLILSHLYSNNRSEADRLMKELLAKYPAYVPSEKDPPELWAVFHDFKVSPYLALGIKAGANFSVPTLTKTFTLDNFPSTEGRYSTNLSYALSLFISRPFSEKIEVFTQPSILNTRINYEGVAFGYATTTIVESQNLVQIPLAIKFNLGNRSDFTKVRKKLNPYVYIGGGVNFLTSSSIKAERTDNLSETSRQVEEVELDITNLREPITYMILGGLGLEYRIGKNHVSLDLNYQYALNNQVNIENRYTDKVLLFDYGYLDSDVNINRFLVSIGYTYSLYKPKSERYKLQKQEEKIQRKEEGNKSNKGKKKKK